MCRPSRPTRWNRAGLLGRFRAGHAGPGRTAGDAAGFFQRYDAVHTGDVSSSTGYPFIDTDDGGRIDGMIAFSQAILADVGPNATIIRDMLS